MLGKLIKNEFKNTYKLMLFVYGAFLLLTIFGTVTAYLLGKDAIEVDFLSVSILIFYGLSFFGIFVATFVFISVNFYRTMFSAQGYLTHTLPAKETSIFNAKLITSFVWILTTVIILFISSLFIINGATNGDFWRDFTNLSYSEICHSFYVETGYYFESLVRYIILFLIMGLLMIVLWIFTSLSIGQLSNKHRIGRSIGTGIGLYFTFQVIAVAAIIKYAGNCNFNINSEDGSIPYFVNSLFSSSLILIVIFNLVMYGFCLYITNRKLNLE